MKNYFISFILLLSTHFWCGKVLAQDKTKAPFYDEIQAFKKLDSLKPAPKNGVLFIGSSSLRKWVALEDIFESYNAINRGFGGSTLKDAIYYNNDLMDHHEPRQVIIYSGENDIAEGNVSAAMVLDRFKTLFGLIRQKVPDVPVAFISIKPSPSRAKYLPVVNESNQLIKKFLRGQRHTVFINVFKKMLDKNKQMRPELFEQDMLHMNDAGYDIWIKAIKPRLVKK